jgi:hypothetical protein
MENWDAGPLAVQSAAEVASDDGLRELRTRADFIIRESAAAVAATRVAVAETRAIIRGSTR